MKFAGHEACLLKMRKMDAEIQSEIQKGRGHLGDLGADRSI